MKLLVLSLVAYGTSALVSLVGIAVASRLFGVGLKRLQLGVGPALLKREIRGVTYGVGLVPWGSYVLFVRPEDPDGVDAFESSRRSIQLLIVGAGLLPLVLLPVILLGPVEAFLSTWHGLTDLPIGAFSPLAAHTMIRSAADLPAATLLGVVLTKLLAIELLPIPATRLWTLLSVAIGAGRRRSLLAPLPVMALGLAWLLAIVNWALG